MSEKKRPPEPTPNVVNSDAVYPWLEEDREDRRSLRASIVTAVVVHLLLLFASIPTLASKEIEPPEEKKVIRIAPTPKMKKETPKPKERPERRERKVPMPSPNPDEIEPFVEDYVEPVIELTYDDELYVLPKEPPPPPDTGPVRANVDVKPPTRIHFVQPRYTEIGRKARIEGMVIVETVIDRQGAVRDATVMRGLPFGLSEEAVKAVEQWRFEPTTLNGKPVEVIFVLTVHFQLN